MLKRNFFFNAGAVFALFIGLGFVVAAREPYIYRNPNTGFYEISTLDNLIELKNCVGWVGSFLVPPRLDQCRQNLYTYE